MYAQCLVYIPTQSSSGLYRYVVYLESLAWSTNGRHKFSCGSVVISNKMGYYEFFTRALKPGVHYVEVDPDNLCDDIVSKVSHQCLTARWQNSTCCSVYDCPNVRSPMTAMTLMLLAALAHSVIQSLNSMSER